MSGSVAQLNEKENEMNCKCPYCKQEIADPDECYEQDTPYEWECRHCGKNFIFYVDYIRTYSEYQAPCLNGGEHEWKPIRGFPEEYFKNKQRCEVCQAERTIGEED